MTSAKDRVTRGEEVSRDKGKTFSNHSTPERAGFLFRGVRFRPLTRHDGATLVNLLCIAENMIATDELVQKHESPGAARYPWENWFELIVAVILGLAALGSAWSAYQSALWSGIQTFRLAESTAAGRRAGEKFVHANQLRGADLVLMPLAAGKRVRDL